MQIVDGLLRIKRIRESAREQDVLRERRALDAATEALERAVEHRRRRDEARQTQEQQMVAKLCAGPVNVREIEWTRVDIDGLRQEADKDRAEEEGVRSRREEVRDLLRAAQQVHRAAVRASEKFQLMADRERASRLEAMERQADLELEEFKARAPDVELEEMA